MTAYGPWRPKSELFSIREDNVKIANILSAITAVTLFLGSPPPAAAGELPKATSDGLDLVKQDELGAVYVKPGASLEPYSQVKLIDAYVAFAKDWRRDYNFDYRRHISDDDLQKIKTKVAAEFKEVFTEQLEKGGYKVTSLIGPEVMVLRPAIINLEITAPDIDRVGRSAVMVDYAGEMTLYMELYDSVTSAKFAEVIDHEIAGDYGYNQFANRGTNLHALDDTLEYWAGLLVKRLDQAHGK